MNLYIQWLRASCPRGVRQTINFNNLMAYLELSFFNSLAVQVQGKRVATFRSANTQALLVYLVLEADKPHARDRLAALFWPDESQRVAKKNLRQSLYHLRKLVGETDQAGQPLLQITRHTAQFNAQSDHSLDVALFQAAIERGDLNSAETHYTGTLLPAFHCDSQQFEQWLDHKRQTLQQTALDALATLTERSLARGQETLSRALALAHRQLDLERWREEAHQQLMRALALSGDRSGAIAQFDICSEVLAEELGVSPAPETFALFEAIRDGTFAPATIKPQSTLGHNLPHQAHRLVGRSAEIDQLTHLLTNTTIPLVTLVGFGGIGKTRLVLHVARQLFTASHPAFADGIHFVPLASLVDAAQLPEQIAQAVGFRWQGKLDELLAFLAPKALLLILDNLEHIQADCHGLITQLLANAPRLKLCVTSRQRLNRQDEQVIALQGLSTVAHDVLDSQAAQLFLAVGERIAPDLQVDGASAAAIGRICQLTDGIPLAIVLAAAWTDILHPSEIAAKIARDRDFLAGEMHDLPARQRSMRATFAYSWAMLSDVERQAFVSLTVFRSGFSRRAAKQVAGIDLRILAQLVRKSLVVYDAVRQRYSIHELLRQYGKQVAETAASDQLATLTAAQQAHSQYYLAAVADRVADMLGRDQRGALRDIAGDYGNVLAAWRWATQAGDVQQIRDALAGMYYFHVLTGRELEGVAHFEQTYQQLRDINSAESTTFLRARLRNRIYELTPIFDSSIMPDVTKLRRQFQAQQATYEEGLLLNRLADAAIEQRDIATAMRIYEEQLALFQHSGDRFEQGLCLTNRMRLGIISGHVEVGLAAGERAKRLFEQDGNRLGISVVTVVLGIYHTLWTGDYAVASDYFRQTLQVGDEMAAVGHVITGVVMAHAYSGFVALLAGDLERARLGASEARRLAERKNTAFTKATALGLDALIALTQGSVERAFALGLQVMGLSRETGSAEFGQLALALSACQLGQPEQAHQVVARQWQAVVQWQRQPSRSLLLLLLPVVAWLYAQQGSHFQAAQLLAAAQAHPACPHAWWDDMTLIQTLKMRLHSALSSEQLAAAQALKMGIPHSAEMIMHDLTGLA